MVVGSASLALVVLVGVGFGATTRCTNTAPVDSTSCDAVDRWAWAGLIVTVLISAAVAVFVDRQYATSVWFLSLAVILTVASIAMLSVTP